MKLSTIQKSISVAILYYAGSKDDDEDTRDCAKGLKESLVRTGHSVKLVSVTNKNWKRTVQTPGDVVFNLVEDDTWELYIKVANQLEKMERVQIGHDLKGLELVINKAIIKKYLRKFRISTPAFKIVNYKTNLQLINNLKYPLIIKPSNQHAGIGISQKSVITNGTQLIEQVSFLLKSYAGEVIVEEFIKGREMHATVIGNDKTIKALPLCEIGFGGKFTKNWSIYTYEAKWDKKSWEYWDARVSSPAKIPVKLSHKIKKMAIKAYKALACRDIARFDFRVDESDHVYLVDANMNPSLNYYDKQDATLASIKALKWKYDFFIDKLANIAFQRLNKVN
jgi:D-alanine-D-alanine ligase